MTNLSNQIAQQNQQYKEGYDSQVNQFLLNEAQSKRQSQAERRQFENQRAMNWANIGADFLTGGLENSWKFDQGFGQTPAQEGAPQITSNNGQIKWENMPRTISGQKAMRNIALQTYPKGSDEWNYFNNLELD